MLETKQLIIYIRRNRYFSLPPSIDRPTPAALDITLNYIVSFLHARPPPACLIYDVQPRDHVVCSRVRIATWENHVRVNRLFSGSPFFRRRSCTTVAYSRLPEISSHKFSSGLNPCSGRACHSRATSFGSK